jgi:hypothetical protein
MEYYPHDVERRWRAWTEVCAAADLLDRALRRLHDADPQLSHYIWLRRTNDLDHQPPARPPPANGDQNR